MVRQRFTQSAAVCCAILFVGCAKSDSKTAADSAGGAAAAPSATPSASTAVTPLSPADVAGTWNVRSVPESGPDTNATLATIIATVDTTGWTESFKNGPTVAMHVSFAGDSIITNVAPYASVRRRRTQVSTHSVYRKVGDKLVGQTTAHYKVKTADSVVTFRSELTKAP